MQNSDMLPRRNLRVMPTVIIDLAWPRAFGRQYVWVINTCEARQADEPTCYSAGQPLCRSASVARGAQRHSGFRPVWSRCPCPVGHDQSMAMARRQQVRRVDGNHILYHFLQKGLLREDVWLFQMLTARLVASLGIWFPVGTYSIVPLLVPHAVRDHTCRKDTVAGRAEAWGSPNAHGYFRDDNSLIKGLPSALPIQSNFGEYCNARIGNGFVACHVWRVLTDGSSASRHPLTYSFIPNPVWLRIQVAKLSDREGSFVQSYLQAIAIKIYRTSPAVPHRQRAVDQAWDLLPHPTEIPLDGLPRLEDLNYFPYSDEFIHSRLRSIKTVRNLIFHTIRGEEGPRVSERYNQGLSSVNSAILASLYGFLDSYIASIEEGIDTAGRQIEVGSGS